MQDRQSAFYWTGQLEIWTKCDELCDRRDDQNGMPAQKRSTPIGEDTRWCSWWRGEPAVQSISTRAAVQNFHGQVILGKKKRRVKFHESIIIVSKLLNRFFFFFLEFLEHVKDDVKYN
jgi:hypothetical protein